MCDFTRAGRAIKHHADAALKQISPVARPSIPPERLLKSLLLMALCTVRSNRLFCEMLEYHILSTGGFWT